MATIFVKLLNLSISGGMLILLVFVFRFILMRTSRRATCLLWIVVGLRLVIPFSFESSLSIMPSGDFVVLDSASDTGKSETALTEQNYPSESEILGNDHATSIDGGSETEYYVGQKPMGSLSSVSEKYIFSTDDHSDIEYFVNQDTSESLQSVSEENMSTTIDNSVIVQGNGSDETLYALPTRIPENAAAGTVSEHTDFLNSLPNRLGFQAKHFWDVLAYVWLLGFVVIAGYAVIGYTQMKRITAEAIPYRDGGAKNIFICDRIDTAFIFGIIKPKIYLPVNLQGKQLENVIAHENVHLIRHDHIRKIVGFMLLMVYWFNPLMWLAYAFFCKDIEFACDEQVISGMSRTEIKEYSDTLLFCSTNLHFMYGCPLAFGEVAVKDRVKAALNYKKPGFWIILVALFLSIGLGILFFTRNTDSMTDDKYEVQKIFDKINNSPCAKFESAEDKGRNIIITSEIKTLSEAFMSLDLVESNEKLNLEQWIFKITFNCREKMINGSEIVVLIGNNGMSINDINFVTHETVPFEKVVELFKSKYQYFKSENDTELTDQTSTDIAIEYTSRRDIGTTYSRLKNGLYEHAGYTYKYRLEITGKMGNPLVDTTYVYLSNIEDITFHQAMMATGLSSSSKDYFTPYTAINVDYYKGNFGGDGSALEIPEKEVKEAILKYLDPTEDITAEEIGNIHAYYGSFSEAGKNEAYCVCRILDQPHVAGMDAMAGVLVDLDTDEISCFNEFRSDKGTIEILTQDNGLSRLLYIGRTESKGSKSFSLKLFNMENGISEVDCGFDTLDLKQISSAETVEYYFNRLTVTGDEGTIVYIWKKDIGKFGRPEPIDTSDVDSGSSLFETISMKFRYNIVDDYEFTFVIPDGTELKNEFGYNSGLWFIDYVKTWSGFENIIRDESLTRPWMENRQSENGYLVISTNEGYLVNNLLGYRIYIKDGYVHLFSYDGANETYIWSADFKDGFKPNMYSLRRILFTKEMYNIYAERCTYEEEISKPGFYPVNKGYLVDLDGDGTKEKLFVASCGWIDIPEQENVDSWVKLPYHNYEDYAGYYGINSGTLIYINGEQQNKSSYIGQNQGYTRTYDFALTDVDVSDGRIEILARDELGDIFFIYKDGKTKEVRTKEGSSFVMRIFDSESGIIGQSEFIARFNGDGTFTSPGLFNLEKYGFKLNAEEITWRMDNDGNVERVPGIYDVPFYYDEESISHMWNDSTRELMEKNIKEHPENYYWKLELTIEAAKDYDDKSAITDNDRIELEPGYYYVDKTDGVSWIHIISPYSKVSGWFDMANLENYVKDYQSTGLDETEDYGKIDIIFSNINHAG